MPTLCFALLTLLLTAGPATATDLEIEFRYQPDSTGQNTTRQRLTIDDGEAEVTENYPSGKVPAEYVRIQERFFETPYR